MSGPAAGRAGEVAALQAALVAEHAAVYGYGLAGSHLAGHQFVRAQRDWALHQQARDQLTAMITGLGGSPVVAAVAYRFPMHARDTRSAEALAAFLENQVVAAYLAVVALPEPRLRAFGARAVAAAAVRATAWSGQTTAFPGLPAGAVSRPGRR